MTTIGFLTQAFLDTVLENYGEELETEVDARIPACVEELCSTTRLSNDGCEIVARLLFPEGSELEVARYGAAELQGRFPELAKLWEELPRPASRVIIKLDNDLFDLLEKPEGVEVVLMDYDTPESIDADTDLIREDVGGRPYVETVYQAGDVIEAGLVKYTREEDRP